MRSSHMTRTGLVVLLGALALLATGCISIKSGQTLVTQRAPGVATLRATFCISDYDQDHYITCNAGDVEEVDSRTGGANTDGDDFSSPLSFQMLVAFRVPDGVTAPQSFPSDARDTTFTFSQSYTDGMTAAYAPVAGEHWVGYISGFKNNLNPASDPDDREFGVQAEFGLPSAADGGPFAGPLKYRIAAGLRALNSSTESGDPVVCPDPAHPTICADTPANTPAATGTPAVFPANLEKPVSDFGVLAGNRATAGQGGTATVSFPVKYADGGGLGAKNLSLTASTTLPGGSATPGATSMQVQPGGTHTMNVNVAVPAAAALGDYRVTLTASNGSPATTRSNTGTLTVADQVSPSIRISTPPNGSTFTFGQAVAADYGCT